MVSQGFDATTIEAVAQRAEVSVGTLYNHFDSKNALLLGVLADATGGVLTENDALVKEVSQDARAALLALMQRYLDWLTGLDRNLLRRAIGLAFTEPMELSAEMLKLDERLIAQIGALVTQLQQRGLLTREVAAEQAALALYASFVAVVMLWLASPAMDAAVLSPLLSQQLSVVIRGLLPSAAERKDLA